MIDKLIKELKIDYIVFPDKESWKNCEKHYPNVIVFDYFHDSVTGALLYHDIIIQEGIYLGGNSNCLLIDNTPIDKELLSNIISKLKEQYDNVKVFLYSENSHDEEA